MLGDARQIADGLRDGRSCRLFRRWPLWILRLTCDVATNPEYKQTLTTLRHTEVGGVERADGRRDNVPWFFVLPALKGMLENRGSRAGLHARHVLHQERLRPKFEHEPYEFVDQRVPRIEDVTCPHVAEPLAGRSTGYQVDLAIGSE